MKAETLLRLFTSSSVITGSNNDATTSACVFPANSKLGAKSKLDSNPEPFSLTNKLEPSSRAKGAVSSDLTLV